LHSGAVALTRAGDISLRYLQRVVDPFE
jgi:hypothetical protein